MSGTSNKARTVAAAALCLGMMTGCRHKVVLAPLPPVQTPVDLIESPPLDIPPMIEAPQVTLPPDPSAAAAARPKRERKRPARTVVPPVQEPAPPAVEPPPVENPIGALTAGSESNPQSKQEAADLIASIEKSLNALPAQMDEDRKTQINKVRNFWRDAQDALKSGDAEGAKMLATKARLLLDDVEK